MVEIFSYDITHHEQYARDQLAVEAFRKQYHLPPAGARHVAVQTKILDFVPKYPAIDLLMKPYQRKMWAGFCFPKNYYLQRFASSYVAPSLGTNEKQLADIHRLEGYLRQQTQGRILRKSPREAREEQEEEEQNEEEQMSDECEKLVNLLEKGIRETNQMVDYIFARMHQFVQA
jgi:hypothetical protein